MNGIAYAGNLIFRARTSTDNVDFSDTQGLTQDEFLRHLNDAQDLLQTNIAKRSVLLFDKEYIVSVVANQEEYPLPADCFGHGRVRSVDYSETSAVDGYYKIPPLSAKHRDSCPNGFIDGYWVRNNSVFLSPPLNISRGSLRITYERELDNVDIRRGTVSELVYDGDTLVGIVFAEDDILDETALASDHWFCFSNRDGVVVQYNVEGDYSSDTKRITVSLSAPTFAIGDFVTVGKYSTTHSALPRDCEGFLVEYITQAVTDRDRVDISQAAGARINNLVGSLLDTFAPAEKDTRKDGDFDYWFR